MRSTKWQDADIKERLEIYDKYCETCQFGFEVGTFEEFDASLRNSCFEAVEKFYRIRG